MKKNIGVIMLLVSLTMVLSGCQKNYADIAEKMQVNYDTAIKEAISEWPDNDYTRAILKPDAGTVDYALCDEEKGYYDICLKDVTMEDGKEYIESLKKVGFETLGSDSNSVSIGTVMRRGSTGVSVCAWENGLGVYIVLDYDENGL